MTVEDVLCDAVDGRSFTTEEEMLGVVELIVEDLVQDAYKWLRRFNDNPRNNAYSLGIDVAEYDDEED